MVDVDEFTDRIDLAADLLWRAEQGVTRARSNHTDAAGFFLVHVADHAAVFDDVLVQLQGARPGADKMPGVERLARAGHGDFPGLHLRRDQVDERRAALQGVDVVHRVTHRLILPVLLPDGDGLGRDVNLLQPANGNERLLHPVLQSFDQGGLRDEAAHSENNAQHGEHGAELVRPDFFEANTDGDQKIHDGCWVALGLGMENLGVVPRPASLLSTFLAILPSRISMRRGVKAAISGSCVTSAMVRPSSLSL